MRGNLKTSTRRAIVSVAALALVAAACGDDDDSSDTTTAGTGSLIGGTVECDASSIAAGLNVPESSIENFQCDQGWAGVTYTDSSGEGQSAILEAEGQFWILKDASSCEGDPPAVPAELTAYCPS